MNIPKDVELFEHTMATFWFDDLGILHSVSKQAPRTIELMEDYIAFVKKLVSNQKVCILSDISKASPMDKKTRDYTATQLEKIYKAMAIISTTPVGNTIGKIFFQLDGQPYPTGMFTDEKEAKEWLKNYL